MRILLAQNSPYYPAHGGGDKSNRLLLEALAARGHECRAVARVSSFGPRQHDDYLAELAARGVNASVPEAGVVAFAREGVEVSIVTGDHPRQHFTAQATDFEPDIILVSTDDPAQLLLEAALRLPRARVVYLARATLAVPFGPDCAFPSEAKTDQLRRVDAVVGVSQYVAGYIRRHSGIEAVHVPISLLEPADAGLPDGQPPFLGRFDNQFVTMVNPCAVKGISIFLALADAFPELAFAAVPTWGTNSSDRVELERRSNIAVLRPADDIDRLLERTRVLLVPSLWAEARSRIVVEAMLRGVPVIASDIGGIPEAKLGVPYLLRVNPIVRYRPQLDEQMVPEAEVPPQDIAPWCGALRRLVTQPRHYDQIAERSRHAALDYAADLSIKPFEELLLGLLDRPPRRAAGPRAAETAREDHLSPERRRLLALRLRRNSPAAAYFPGAEAAEGPRVFCLPHAGAGAAAYAGWKLAGAAVCPVRLPGRESRIAQAPFERMRPLVEALAAAIAAYLDRPYALFGHSMGAVVAFELARELRRRGQPAARVLIASGARAPRYRRGYVPGPDPSDAELLDELRQIGGPDREWLDVSSIAPAVLPALRADTSLYRHYVYQEDEPLDCPIRAYGGLADGRVTAEHLRGWSAETRAPFALRQFTGGHFYLQPLSEGLRDAIEEDLRGTGL